VVEGERILGRFTVGERIGRGGYGTVHRAWDERLCRHVAVKEVEGEAAGRVLREAHAAARLNHPGIVTLYELGSERGTAYLVSELVRGPNLREYAASGHLSDRDLAEIGAELCGALGHAHAQGVVHRDLKPDNVLIRARGGRRMRGSGERAMLADFGIASLADEPGLTATGQVVGTLAYMAPEQAAGEPAAEACDIYSLALTLYELWAGRNPVAGATPAETAKRIGTELPSLAEDRPELPPQLHAAIDAALTPDPELRPSLEELHGALESVAGALHPERAVPEPEEPEQLTPLPEGLPARPFAVLLAAGALAALGLLTGRPGLALVTAALLAPAALLLAHPREWLLPALAPLLGVVGLAPLFIVFAANRTGPARAATLAGLAWAWTGIVGLAVGRTLGVSSGAAGPWVGSGRDAIGDLLAPLASGEAISVALVWVGAALLLALLLEAAGPAAIAVFGMVWAAGLVAALGAIGGPAAPSLLLTPALAGALGWLAWDRAGRPDPRPFLERLAPSERGPARAPVPAAAAPGRTPPRRPRRGAPEPLPDSPTRAARAATRHVDAALYQAGSQAGLP